VTTYTPGQILAVFVLLNCAGYLYHLVVDTLAHHLPPRWRRTSVEVVVGVSMTLLGVSFLVGPFVTLLYFMAFAMTGLWMIYGDFKRGERVVG